MIDDHKLPYNFVPTALIFKIATCTTVTDPIRENNLKHLIHFAVLSIAYKNISSYFSFKKKLV